jgi:hypothetical protein
MGEDSRALRVGVSGGQALSRASGLLALLELASPPNVQWCRFTHQSARQWLACDQRLHGASALGYIPKTDNAKSCKSYLPEVLSSNRVLEGKTV